MEKNLKDVLTNGYEELQWEEKAEDYEEGFRGNMPCDTYGEAACSRSCPRYFVCNG